MFQNLILSLSAIIAILTTIGATLAGEVQMKMRDSTLVFTGTIINFNGNVYRLDTKSFGKVNLDIKRFECVAGDCPNPKRKLAVAPGNDLAIIDKSGVDRNLMPVLIGGYAQSVSLQTTGLTSDQLNGTKIGLSGKNGNNTVNIDLAPPGIEDAFAALSTQKAHIVLSSRLIKTAEATLLPNYREHVLGQDGLAILVSPQNPQSNISIAQLAAVFSGTIANWSQLGQPPGKINIYTPNRESATFKTFKSLVLDVSNAKMSPIATRFASDAELSDAIVRDPRGIGFVSILHKGNAKSLAISQTCGITYPPSMFHIKAGEYPLVRDIILYAASIPGPAHAEGLINYALSSAAQGIMARAGVVTRSVGYLDFNRQSDRVSKALNEPTDEFNPTIFRKLVRDITPLSRLSVTFRFRNASFVLEERSQQNVQRLAKFLRARNLDSKNILLLGFSDSVGSFDSNRDLSTVRAQHVKRELMKTAGTSLDAYRVTAKGYGELLPVGCNDTELGRAQNRRVEVWLAPSSVDWQEALFHEFLEYSGSEPK